MKRCTNMNEGVLYIAFGDKYIEQAEKSALSLRKVQSAHITIFCDRDISSPMFDVVRKVHPEHNRAKVDFIKETPYVKTIYLDSDIKIIRNISEIFEILEYFEFVGTHDLSRKRQEWSEKIPEYEKIPYGFTEINGGVLGIKKTKASCQLINLWTKKFYQYRQLTRNQDQPALRMALWESNVRYHILPVEFNVRNETIRSKIIQRMKTEGNSDLMRPRIWHFHGCHESTVFKRMMKKFRAFKVI